ncbi:MAG: DsbA family oxidoreductase [Gammaproteobacteria bacterium]|nr:DsbA family oxidoreductase [Gammaproteobacteria bacterium]
MNLPELKVTVFSDYICPFCYVGHHRLMRLRDQYDLKINWRFLEIHPETAAEGEPVTSLQYPSEQWYQMMQNLEVIARQEGIEMAEHNFTTNSRDALLLSEAAKEQGRDKFYALHEKLFAAFFVHGKNIGDRSILRELATESMIDEEAVEQAWQDNKYQQRINANYHEARQLEIHAVPSFVFGDRKLTGVVPEHTMRSAAGELVSPDPDQ